MLPPDQRRTLGAFLRARRDALPSLPDGTRRRAPGLKREEVAGAANVSLTWLVWVEQGREVALSPAALARLATALHLTQAERAYLFDLACAHDPAAPPLPTTAPPPGELRALLHDFRGPAYLLDALYTARAWNPEAQTLFAPWYETGEPNLLRFVFLHPVARQFILDWERRSKNLVAEFRAETAHTPGNPDQAALIATLRQESPDFARFWTAQDVRLREGGARGFLRPDGSTAQYVQTTLIPAAHPAWRMVALQAA